MSRMRVSPGPLRGSVRAPPSKSYTHRELVVSYLAIGRSELIRPLVANDTLATARGIERLGARVVRRGGTWLVEPPRSPSRTSPRQVSIRCGESGTSLRFLLALAATRTYPVRITGGPVLSKRPIDGLLDFLGSAGATIRRPAGGASLPVTVRGPLSVGRGRVDVSQSSQYLSALLLTLPSLPGSSKVDAVGKSVSAPYVDATQDVLSRRGVAWTVSGASYRIDGPVAFRAKRVAIPGDASSAAYLWAGAAASGGRVRVKGIPKARPQADLRILGILHRMGARVLRHPDGATVLGSSLRGITLDLTQAPDLVPLLGALAALSSGATRIRGAIHASQKESDRRRTTCALIRGLGGNPKLLSTHIDVAPQPARRPLDLRDARDHRIVMSAAVASLALSGPSTIEDAGAVRKSFPTFWSTLRELGASVTAVRP